MIKIPGKLIVQVRKGSRGAFAVGDLITEVGNFKVKDPFLDQFTEGVYEGEFAISQIYPYSYAYRGCITLEIRVKVVDYILATAEEKQVPPEPEPDPMDQASQPAPVSPALPAAAAPVESTESKAPEHESTEPAAPASLFDAEMSDAIAAHAPIKLDPTIDRQRFRQQRDHLKATGYRFSSTDQVWNYSESPSQ